MVNVKMDNEFVKYMKSSKVVNRWKIFVVGLIGAFAGVEQDYARAAVAALVCFEVAAELAADHSAGPGSFKENFFDEVFNLDKIKIQRMAKVVERDLTSD